eukprot:GHVR01033887.1.p1 GENE.GHVR01033887.1~~GHVR01033887.1.p1  ORF type:complete len:105 (+),score=9.15 GHVR01033887.1:249-563(+)
MQTHEDGWIELPVKDTNGMSTKLRLKGSLMTQEAPRCLINTPSELFLSQNRQKGSWASFEHCTKGTVPVTLSNKQHIIQLACHVQKDLTSVSLFRTLSSWTSVC